MNQRKRRSTHLPTAHEPNRKRLAVQPLRLIELNQNALEDIFMYLDINDLVNVVKSEDAYLTTCQNVFRRKYGKKCLRMELTGHSQQTKKKNFRRLAQLLRYFGRFVSGLHVSIEANSPIDHRFFHIFVTCCRYTLSALHVSRPTDQLNLNRPFVNVKQLTFSKGNVNISPGQIVKYFPAVENLIFDSIGNVGRFLKDARKISTLKSLQITSYNQPLHVPFRYHIDEFHKFIAINSQIREIQLMLGDHFVDTFERKTTSNLHTETVPDHPLSVKLYIIMKLDENEFKRSDALERLKVPCDRIEHLSIHIVDITAQICGYMARCQNVKTLTVTTVLFLSRWYEHNAFRKPSWTNLAALDDLQELNMNLLDLPSYGDNVNDFSRYALDAIQPFLQHERLAKINFRIEIQRELSFAKVFEPIRSSIDSRIWMFEQTLSSDEIFFTLTKISV